MIPLTCDEVQNRISALLAGDEAGGEDLEAHLAECAACRAKAEAWFRQDRALNELAAVEQQERLRARLREALLNQTSQAAATTRKPSSRRSRQRMRPARRQDRWPISFTLAIAAGLLLAIAVLLAFLNNRPAPRVANPGPGRKPAPSVIPDTQRERQRAIEQFQQAEARRREVAERLAEAERQRVEHQRQLEEARARAQEEAERIRIEAQLAEARRKAESARPDEEKELERARNESRNAQATVAQLAPHVSVFGKVLFVGKDNRATLVRGEQREALSVGRELQAGDRIDTGAVVQILGTSSPETEAVFELACGARVDLAANSLFELNGPDTTTLLRGRLYADVDLKKGATGTPYVYFKTPHADVFVTGTRFDLASNAVESRVRMEEGKVTFDNKRGSRSVKALQECVAPSGSAPSAPAAAKPGELWRGQRGPLGGEIVLFPQDGQLIGAEWKLVPDPDALSGRALEALTTQSLSAAGAPARAVSWVNFTFSAEAGKDYTLWVRGKAGKVAENPIAHDAVWIDFPDAESVKGSGPNQREVGEKQVLVNGYMFRDGYVWLAGDADPPGWMDGKRDPLSDLPATTIRFAKSGKQTIRLNAKETPIRIDAIWISETQKDRPTWGR